MTEPGEPDAAEPVTWAGVSGRGRAAMAAAGMALLVGLGWGGAALVGLPAARTGGGPEPSREPATPLETVQAAGFAVQACPDEAAARTCLVYEPDWEGSRDFGADMAVLTAQADALDVAGLDLRNVDGLASLEPLRGMELTYLRLGPAREITSLEPLTGMPLRRLSIKGVDGLTSLEPLRGMPLTSLTLWDADSLTSLEPLRGMPLNQLDLSGTTDIASLEPLRGMPLQMLGLAGSAEITSLEPLRGMPLVMLSLQGATGTTSLEPLQGMRFWSLDLSGATGITSLAPLRGLDPKVIRGASEALLATLER